MAIVKEKKDGGLVRTYSDAGYYIHGGNPEWDYKEAIDPEDSNRTYTETSKKIDTKESTEEKAKAYDILMGEAVNNE